MLWYKQFPFNILSIVSISFVSISFPFSLLYTRVFVFLPYTMLRLPSHLRAVSYDSRASYQTTTPSPLRHCCQRLNSYSHYTFFALPHSALSGKRVSGLLVRSAAIARVGTGIRHCAPTWRTMLHLLQDVPSPSSRCADPRY